MLSVWTVDLNEKIMRDKNWKIGSYKKEKYLQCFEFF